MAYANLLAPLGAAPAALHLAPGVPVLMPAGTPATVQLAVAAPDAWESPQHRPISFTPSAQRLMRQHVETERPRAQAAESPQGLRLAGTDASGEAQNEPLPARQRLQCFILSE